MNTLADVALTATPAPRDPVEAATHRDPYPYYASLVADTPLYRDDALGLWVASDAATVEVVLTSALCRVRPLTEPVPKALVGSAAGEIFRHLVRMIDGESHCPFKQAVSATLDSLDPARVGAAGSRWAERLSASIGPQTDPHDLNTFTFALSAHVIAALLGASDDVVPEVARLVGDLVRAFAPGSTAEQVATGSAAAERLLELFRRELQEGRDTLVASLAAQARRFGSDDAAVALANAIGFLTQAYDATAGLMGNTLTTLAALPDVLRRLHATPAILGEVIAEVLRYDSPVQNTRRFLAADGIVAGQAMKQGDAILILLAAANRDPAANAGPDRFDETRRDRKIFTFGIGVHACPGQLLATTIASAGVAELLRKGIDPAMLDPHPAYRPSGNVRVPVLRKV